jgi:hypothetical protein
VLLLVTVPALPQLADPDLVCDALRARPPASSNAGVTDEHFKDIALVVTRPFDNHLRDSIRTTIENEGGRVYLIYGPNVMIGRIPAAAHAKLHGRNGIALVTNRPVDVSQIGVSDHNARTGVRFFNWIVSGEKEREEERVRHIRVDLANLNEHRLRKTGAPAQERNTTQSVSLSHTSFPNDVLDGFTGVEVFFLESVDDPSTQQNENQYTWTVQHHNETANRIGAGFYWWVEIANLLGIQPAVSYQMTFWPGSYAQQQVPFEPILHNAWPSDFDWIARVTAAHGVTAGEDSRTRSRNYGEHIRSQLGAKNGFPVYVSYNPPGAPTTHLDGLVAYGWYGDYIHILYQNNGYPVEQSGWVFAHEMGHVYYACDEYWQECQRYPNCTNCYGTGEGPRPASMNWNCELCTPGGPTACIMHAINDFTWYNHSTCEHTRRMIGWPY